MRKGVFGISKDALSHVIDNKPFTDLRSYAFFVGMA